MDNVAPPISHLIARRRTEMGPLWADSMPPPQRTMELSLSTASLIVLFRPTADAVDSQTHMTIPPLQSSSRLGSLDHVFLPTSIPIKEHGHVVWSALHSGKTLSAPHGQPGEKILFAMLV